jgi:hypothetical protein
MGELKRYRPMISDTLKNIKNMMIPTAKRFIQSSIKLITGSTFLRNSTSFQAGVWLVFDTASCVIILPMTSCPTKTAGRCV